MAKITNELIAEKNATIDKIYNLKDNEQIKVMVLRYSEGMTRDEIGLSRRNNFKVHKQAMAKLNN